MNESPGTVMLAYQQQKSERVPDIGIIGLYRHRFAQEVGALLVRIEPKSVLRAEA